MLPCLVNSRLHSRHGSPRSSCVSLISTLDSYPGIPIPSGLLTSFSSNIPTFKPSNLQTSQCSSTYLLYFPLFAHSFARIKISSPLFSNASVLFGKNHPGWGYPHSFLEEKNETKNC